MCKVFDLNGDCVMISLKTCNNCYVVCQNKLFPLLLLCLKVLKLILLITCGIIDWFKNENGCVILKIRSDRGGKWMMSVSFIDQRIIFIILEPNSLALDIAPIKTLWKTNLFPSNMFLLSVKWLISSLSFGCSQVWVT